MPPGTATINTAGKFGGDGDGKVFTVKITDAVGIVVQQTVTVNIHNTDATLPTISVTDIALPADLKDWTSADLAGHIETAAVSRYNGGDADVSGTVMVRGTAHDNVRIDRIQLSIDGGAAVHRRPLERHGPRVRPARTVPHLQRHAVRLPATTWPGTTSGTPPPSRPTAKNNVVLSFVARDHSSNDSAAGTKQYDVVPYITRVDTAITGYISKDFNRSALGRYPVRAGETITLRGYNLKPTNTGIGVGTSDVRIVSARQPGQRCQDGPRPRCTRSVVSPYTSMTATISTLAADASIGSGYLVVWVNGVPSINAISARSNAETNFVSATGTDERWLTVWDLTVFKTAYAAAAPNANHAVYPSMAMNGNTPVFAYVNNVQGYGLAEYWNGSAESEDLRELGPVHLHRPRPELERQPRGAVRHQRRAARARINCPATRGGSSPPSSTSPPNTAWSSTSYYFRDYHIWLDNLFKSGVSAVLGRYQYPDMKVTGDNALTTTVYYSVYDAIDDRVLVRAFNVGTNAASVGQREQDHRQHDKRRRVAQPLHQHGSRTRRRDVACRPTRMRTRRPTTGASGTTTTRASPRRGPTWSPPGRVPGQPSPRTSGGNGRGGLVRHGSQPAEVRLQHGSQRRSPADLDGTQTLDSFCGGDFVDMAVDSGNHIHIAYHDSYSGDLKYVYIDTYNGTPSGPYVVDSYLTVGNKASITVNAAGVPYITYKGMGNTAKAAWLRRRTGRRGRREREVQRRLGGPGVPARIVDNDTNRFCMGVDASSLPVVGYTNDGIEYIRRLADLP